MFQLTGKSAVVTGAGSGIGEAMAHCFAKAGAVVFLAEVNAESGQRVADAIRAASGQARFVHTDVSNEASCNACAVAVHQATGGVLDVLVNNAGIGHVGTVLTTTPADLDRLYAVNVRGAMHMSRAFLPAMVERRQGSIINMASIAGLVAVRERLAYSVTKHAIVGMTRCMALDHAASQVRVNCICPGRVETPWIQQRLKEYPDPRKAYEEMCATQPLGRMAKPEEIAAAALYLASDEAAMVTGACLSIDGGWSAG
jgi:2-keto-3-deoxy-L-fuconate dehydrogenase